MLLLRNLHCQYSVNASRLAYPSTKPKFCGPTLLCKEKICVGYIQQCVLRLEQSTWTASKQLKRLEGAFVPRRSSLQFIALAMAVGLVYAAEVPWYHAACVLKHWLLFMFISTTCIEVFHVTFTSLSAKICNLFNGGEGPEWPQAETGSTSWNTLPGSDEFVLLKVGYWKEMLTLGFEFSDLAVLLLYLTLVGIWRGEQAEQTLCCWADVVLLSILWSAQTCKLLCKSISPNHLSCNWANGRTSEFSWAFVCIKKWFGNSIKKFAKKKTNKSSQAIPHLLHLY